MRNITDGSNSRLQRTAAVRPFHWRSRRFATALDSYDAMTFVHPFVEGTERLAHMLGLRFFGPGNHTECAVTYAWHACIKPSFEPQFIFGVAALQRYDHRPETQSMIRFAFAARDGDSGVVALDRSRLVLALLAVDIFHVGSP